MIYEDSQAKPDVGLTKAKKLVEKDGVAFLGGVVSSSVAYALRDYVVSKNIPYVVTVASADGLTQQLAAPNISVLTAPAAKSAIHWANGCTKKAATGSSF